MKFINDIIKKYENEIENYKHKITGKSNVLKAINDVLYKVRDVELYDFDVWEQTGGLNDKHYYISAKTENEATNKLIELYGENEQEIRDSIKIGVIQVSILEYD